MSNPNLVRKLADQPSNGSGEISFPQVLEQNDKGRNFIMNSNFDFWQRFGANVTFTSNAYIVDRWFAGATGSVNYARVGTSFGTPPPTGSSVALQLFYPSAGNNVNDFYYFEDFDVNAMKGKTVTWSMYMRCPQGNMNNGLALRVYKNATANTRNGGTWVQIGTNTMIADADISGLTWKLVSVTFAVPDDGTANGLRINVVNTTNITVPNSILQIAQMMLNIGTSRTPYVYYGGTKESDERACKRYFQKSYAIDTAPGTPGQTGSAFSGAPDAATNYHFTTYQFEVEMRTTPSVTGWNPQNANVSGTTNVVWDGPAGTSRNINFYGQSSKGINAHVSGASNAGSTLYVHFTADAEFT